MGGGTGAGAGNVTPLAEHNFWADPEAATMVIASSMPTMIVGWDILVSTGSFSVEKADQLHNLGTEYAEIVVDIQDTLNTYATAASHPSGLDLSAPMTMAAPLNPVIAESDHLFIEVLMGARPTRDVQSTDWRRLTSNEPNAWVVTAVPRQAFPDAVYRGLS